MFDVEELIQEIKPEFLNEKIIKDTQWESVKARSYAKGWNACNSHYIDALKMFFCKMDEEVE